MAIIALLTFVASLVSTVMFFEAAERMAVTALPWDWIALVASCPSLAAETRALLVAVRSVAADSSGPVVQVRMSAHVMAMAYLSFFDETGGQGSGTSARTWFIDCWLMSSVAWNWVAQL